MRCSHGAGAALAVLLVLPALAASGASACGSEDEETPGGSDIRGRAPDWNGTTGSGDAELNAEVESEADTEVPDDPACAPGSSASEDGACVEGCADAGGICAAVSAAHCEGLEPISAHDCATCCAPAVDEAGEPIFDFASCNYDGACEETENPDECDECWNADAGGGEPSGGSCVFEEDCLGVGTCNFDGVCGADESADGCGDCFFEEPGSCGDDSWDDATEDCETCPLDTPDCFQDGLSWTCGDGECSLEAGESCKACRQDCGPCFKVMTWNIAAGRKRGTSPARVQRTLRAISKAIARERPDLVALQEVDKGTERSGSVDQAEFVARRIKMWKRFGAAFKFDGGYYGVAFLSRYPVGAATRVPMDTSLEWDKRRVLLVGDIDLQGELRVRLGVTQLAGSAAPRLEQAAQVSALGEEDFSIVAGDMRDLPGSETLQVLTQRGLFDAWEAVRDEGQPTHKAGRIDHVLPGVDGIPDPDAFGRMPIVYARIPATRGLSDHRPVVAYFQRPRGGEAKEAVGEACASPCAADADCQENACGFGRCVEGLCAECLSDAECVGELGYERGSACDAVTRWCF